MRRASLNHNYRLVWSDHANAYVAVAEGTRSRGKSTRAGLVAVAMAQLLSGTSVYADGVVVAPGSGGTNVYNAPNGVPVVNIDKANAAGLSHNKYLDYNVGVNGLILNNGNSSQIARQSQLAGQVIANTNLATEAKFILNEVVSTNSTQLLGYTEVLGGKADVIIANPYGITCGGCGFINTDRVTLTTGTPNLLSSGALGGFTVNQGDILIHGTGLDATNQSYFDIVTRSLKIDGQVNTKELHIVTGTNTWDYGTRNVTVNTASGAAPSYAFDSTALGGMYANRIFIKATEAGVGVRMLGEAAASADDFTINAAGKIEIKSKVSAERDIALTTTSAVTGAMTLTDAQITAKRNLEMTAQTGNATFNGGLLVAGNNLTGVFASLDDTANTTAVTDNNKRYAEGALSLTVTNAANINGTNWGAKGNLTGSVGSLNIGTNGASIYSTNEALKLTATTGNLSLGTAAIQAVKNIDFIATAGNVSTSAGSAQGVKTTKGNININAQTGLSNAGVMSADAGSFTLRANGNSTNSGTIYAKTTADIADKTNTATQNFTNSGTLIADDTLALKASALTNSGKLQAAKGSTVSVTNALNNTGTLIGSTESTGATTLTVGTLTNSSAGTIQSKQNLTINVNGATLTNAGKLLADDDLTIESKGTGLTVTNQNGGFIQAGTSTGDDLVIKGTKVTLSNNSNAVMLGDVLDLVIDAIDNAGSIQGGAGASKIQVTNTLTNSGKLNLANVTAGSGTITADTIANTGTLQSGGAANLNVATALNNSNQLLTTGALTVRGTDSAYTVNNTGRMQSGGLMDIKGKDATKGVDVTIGSSAVMFANSLDMKAGTLTIENGGMLTSTADLTADVDNLSLAGSGSKVVGSTAGGTTSLTVANEFTNPGVVHSGGTLTFSAAGISNESTGGISGNTVNLTATSNSINNAGAIYAANQLNVKTESTAGVTNAQTGTVDSGGSISVTTGVFVNRNTVNATQDISITALNFVNAYEGLEQLTRQYDSSISWGDAVETDRQEDGTPTDITIYFEKTGTKKEYFLIDGNKVYSNPIPTGAVKPQIIAGRNMTVSGFENAVNIGGVLAATSGTMNITGTGTFVNDDLSLNTKTYKATWNDYYDVSISVTNPLTVTKNRSYNEKETGASSQTFGSAGIFAQTLNASGFSLELKSAAFSPTVNSKTASGTSSTSLGSNVTAANGAPAVSFGGLVIALPTNPNGFFIVSKDPNSKYLVETNPLFNVGSDYIGSDYMAKRLGLNPDLVGLRLGDAAYETNLIRQQLIAQTGKNILNGFASENNMIEKLYQNAANAASGLGLAWGKAPTPSQLTNLKEDMVWMVETVVAGRKVLAPVVYLAKATKDNIQSGAVIAAKKTNLDLKSVTNTGGTIEGKESLAIKSEGDVTNVGGKIKGGDVSVTSTSGSIVNKTATSGSVLGKTAGIESTKTLKLDANKDILVQGGEVSSAGKASLKAGNDITFETVKLEQSSGSSANGSSSVKNVGSKLNVGGDLDLASGGNTTLKGSAADIKGNLKADIKGEFNVLAVQDQETKTSTSSRTGAGVGGGVYGSETTSTTDFTGTNKGSTLKVGGNMQVKADKATIQGSDVEAKGDLSIDAKKGIEILDGLDEKSVTTTTTSTTVGVVGSSSGADAGSGSSSKNKKASANASASAENNNDLKAVETTTRVQSKTTKTSVASTLKSGGNMSLKAAEGTVKVQGSNVDAGGDLDIDAKNVEVLTGRNEVIESDTTQKESVGMYQQNTASAEAGANANGNRGQAGAKSTANANSTSTFGAQKETNSKSSYDLKNTASTLKSGGNMKVKAQETAKFVGAEVESKGDLAIEAKDIVNQAAKDISTTSESNSKETAGVYVELDLSAEAGAQGDASTMTGDAKAEASAEAGVGLRVAKESSEEGTRKVTNKTNSFKSGGNITRKAENKIVDQGTQLDAAGSIEQSAKIIDDQAIHDEDTTTSSSENIDARIGVTAGASAGASADSSGNADAGAGAGYGFKASVKGGSASSSETSKTAVTSKYKAGKSITSTSTEKTTLTGTVFEAGEKVKIKAGTLEYKAAEDSKTSTGKTDDYNAELKVGGDSAEAKAGYSNTRNAADSTTAKAGAINAGGGIEIETTSGDVTLVGTDIKSATGDVAISSAGNVNLESAVSKSSSTDSSVDVSASVSGSKGEGGDKKGAGMIKGGFEKDSESSTTNKAVNISGSGVKINAKKDVNNQSATIDAKKAPAQVKAGGKVNNTAVKDTKKSSSVGVSAVAGVSGKSKAKK